MKVTGTDRRIWASILAGGAAMALCFALRGTAMAPLERLAYDPPAVTETAEDGDRVNINTAGLEELMTLSGIGAVRAQAILDDREANGPYRRPEDLIRVKGIGEGILAGILDQITTGGDEDAENTGG